MTPEERAAFLCERIGRDAREDLIILLRHARREAYEDAAKIADHCHGMSNREIAVVIRSRIQGERSR